MNLATSIRFFYLLILLLFLNCSSSGDDDYNLGNDNNENSLPKLTTYPVTDVKLYSAKSGGNIDGDGGYDIITKGIVWGIYPNPTITLSTKTEEGNGSVDFTSEIQNLQQDTQYYVRAYATNSENKTGYGNQRNFNTVDPTIYDGDGVTDIDGNYYSSLIFRHQEWSSVNLSVTRYRNGDEIPQVQDPNEWANLTTGAWCYYNNDPNNESYGKLYNWYAIEDPRGLAPEGWHVPLDSEWETLSSFIILAGYNFISEDFTSNNFAKSVSSTSFQQGTSSPSACSPAFNPALNNSTGFNALPSGSRNGVSGDFDWIDKYTAWWTKSYASNETIKKRRLGGHLCDGFVGNVSSIKSFGASIRIIKD